MTRTMLVDIGRREFLGMRKTVLGVIRLSGLLDTTPNEELA